MASKTFYECGCMEQGDQFFDCGNHGRGAAAPFPKAAENVRHGDPRFYALLEEMAQTHSKKSYDYTPQDDPLANFKRSEKLGVPAWKGCLVRMGDKTGRIEQLASGKDPKNESLRDTLMDLAVYSLLCVLLLEDAKG